MATSIRLTMTLAIFDIRFYSPSGEGFRSVEDSFTAEGVKELLSQVNL